MCECDKNKEKNVENEELNTFECDYYECDKWRDKYDISL